MNLDTKGHIDMHQQLISLFRILFPPTPFNNHKSAYMVKSTRYFILKNEL